METNLITLVNSLRDIKQIDIQKLPTQGYFYPTDMKLSIKKASIEDIIEYNFHINQDDYFSVIFNTKEIIRKNIITNYSYEDIKSNDIIYLFFEIVKFTTNKDILVDYNGEKVSAHDFNYFKYSSLHYEYDENTREFISEGYRISMPSVGAEDSIVNYLVKRNLTEDFYFDFLFLLGNKGNLLDHEIDNLIELFNNDLDNNSINKIKEIVDKFLKSVPHSVIINDEVVLLNNKNINFGNIFSNKLYI
jgi:hypothetical protein